MDILAFFVCVGEEKIFIFLGSLIGTCGLHWQIDKRKGIQITFIINLLIFMCIDAFKKWKGHKNKWFETKHLNLHK